MKITVGIPCNRQIRPLTTISLLEMVARGKYDFHFALETEGITVADNRNKIVIRAQEAKSDYLLFVDDDMVFPPDTLDRLIARNKEVIGVNAQMRHSARGSTVIRNVPSAPLPRNLFNCHYIGASILLVEISVFSKIPKPWFKIEVYKDGKVKLGEDAWFCEQVRAAGIEIWCDPTIKVGHIGDYIY